MLRAALIVFLGAFALAAAPRLPEKYDRWLNQEVVYLITNEERKAFLQLENDAGRDRYIAEFWEARNPARGSGRNPFREEHYRRVEYANANFGRETGTPGWKTDMGRTWILFGKPESRVPLKGFSQIYPLELWMYGNSTGSKALPGFFYVMFFMPEDIGEYQFYRPFSDGPLKLVRGTQFRTNRDVYRFLQTIRGDVAHAAFSLTPSEPLDTDNFGPSMMSDAMVARIQDWANTPEIVERIRAGRALTPRVTSVMLVADQRQPSVEILPLAGFDGSWWLDYAVLVDDERYGRAENGKLSVSAGFRLLNGKGELIVEDSEDRAYDAYDDKGAFVPFVLANRVPMLPGAYRLEVTLTNRFLNRIYKVEREVAVGGAGVALAGPVIATAVEKAADSQTDAPFRFSGVQFFPSGDARFAPRVPLRTLIQVRAPAGEAQNYTLEYVLAHLTDRTQRAVMTDRIAATEFRNGILLKSRTLSTEGLATGEYRAIVNLRSPSSPRVLASVSAPLRIEEAFRFRNFYLLANLRGAAANGLASYIRGLEAAAQGDPASAQRYLREAVRANPANTAAQAALTSMK